MYSLSILVFQLLHGKHFQFDMKTSETRRYSYGIMLEDGSPSSSLPTVRIYRSNLDDLIVLDCAVTIFNCVTPTLRYVGWDWTEARPPSIIPQVCLIVLILFSIVLASISRYKEGGFRSSAPLPL